MKLDQLYPKLSETGILTFICPNCIGTDYEHRIRVPLSPAKDSKGQSWEHSGSLEDLTLTPSIDVACWHGEIKNGSIERCK